MDYDGTRLQSIDGRDGQIVRLFPGDLYRG